LRRRLNVVSTHRREIVLRLLPTFIYRPRRPPSGSARGRDIRSVEALEIRCERGAPSNVGANSLAGDPARDHLQTERGLEPAIGRYSRSRLPGPSVVAAEHSKTGVAPRHTEPRA